ncbi:MAG: hypothetical protein KGQ36_02200 [Rickettsiales bacterium]|nr:hypothetical protein [Rickettsiales bacterium]
MPESNNLPSKSSFHQDQTYLFEEIIRYLNNKSENSSTYQSHRAEASEKIKSGNFIDAINNLEDARDIKRGIFTFKSKSLNGETPVLIRDARTCKSGIPEGVEAAEIIVLAAFEAAKDIIKFDSSTKDNNVSHLEKLQKMAVDFFEDFAPQNNGKSDKKLFYKSNIELNKIGEFLTSYGVKNAKTKITEALHFQNFKQSENYNPVTISTIKDEKGGSHTLVEANVAFKQLTDEQKRLYDKIIDEKAVSELQISLMKTYREEFFSGKYSIPTQLINTVPGVRNAFEEFTLLARNSDKKSNISGDDLELIDVRKRAGALPTIISKNKKLTEEITGANARQANMLMSSDEIKLHWNSLNTHFPIVGQSFGGYESDIVKHTRRAAKDNYINFTVTPLNRFRRIGAISDLKEIKNYLNALADSLQNDDLKEHIRPRNFLDKISGSKPKSDFEQILSEIEKENSNSDFAKIIRLAKSVKEAVDKAGTTIRISDGFDEENISLKISTKFSRLTKLVNQGFYRKDSDLHANCDITKVPLEEVVISCKSAKDRTGLSMFYRMAKILKSEVDVSFAKICDTLHSSGHMEYLPGSFRVGGGTPGCYQLQSPVLTALPKSEKQHLEVIVGPFSHNNKGPKPKFFDKVKDYAFAKKIALIDKFDQTANTKDTRHIPLPEIPKEESLTESKELIREKIPAKNFTATRLSKQLKTEEQGQVR